MDWYEVTGNRSRIRRVLRFFEEQNFFVVRSGPNKFYTHVHPELSKDMIKILLTLITPAPHSPC